MAYRILAIIMSIIAMCALALSMHAPSAYADDPVAGEVADPTELGLALSLDRPNYSELDQATLQIHVTNETLSTHKMSTLSISVPSGIVLADTDKSSFEIGAIPQGADDIYEISLSRDLALVQTGEISATGDEFPIAGAIAIISIIAAAFLLMRSVREEGAIKLNVASVVSIVVIASMAIGMVFFTLPSYADPTPADVAAADRDVRDHSVTQRIDVIYAGQPYSIEVILSSKTGYVGNDPQTDLPPEGIVYLDGVRAVRDGITWHESGEDSSIEAVVIGPAAKLIKDGDVIITPAGAIDDLLHAIKVESISDEGDGAVRLHGHVPELPEYIESINIDETVSGGNVTFVPASGVKVESSQGVTSSSKAGDAAPLSANAARVSNAAGDEEGSAASNAAESEGEATETRASATDLPKAVSAFTLSSPLAANQGKYSLGATSPSEGSDEPSEICISIGQSNKEDDTEIADGDSSETDNVLGMTGEIRLRPTAHSNIVYDISGMRKSEAYLELGEDINVTMSFGVEREDDYVDTLFGERKKAEGELGEIEIPLPYGFRLAAVTKLVAEANGQIEVEANTSTKLGASYDGSKVEPIFHQDEIAMKASAGVAGKVGVEEEIQVQLAKLDLIGVYGGAGADGEFKATTHLGAPIPCIDLDASLYGEVGARIYIPFNTIELNAEVLRGDVFAVHIEDWKIVDRCSYEGGSADPGDHQILTGTVQRTTINDRETETQMLVNAYDYGYYSYVLVSLDSMMSFGGYNLDEYKENEECILVIADKYKELDGKRIRFYIDGPVDWPSDTSGVTLGGFANIVVTEVLGNVAPGEFEGEQVSEHRVSGTVRSISFENRKKEVAGLNSYYSYLPSPDQKVAILELDSPVTLTGFDRFSVKSTFECRMIKLPDTCSIFDGNHVNVILWDGNPALITTPLKQPAFYDCALTRLGARLVSADGENLSLKPYEHFNE